MNNETLLIAFVAVTAVAVLLQAFVLLALYLAVRRTSVAVETVVDDLRDALVPITPMVRNARNTLDRISPKVEVAVDNLVAITEDLRTQSADVHESATEMIGRLRSQVGRVDVMLTGVLDSVEKTAGFLRNAVSLPARQLGGILAALRAITDTLRGVQHEEPELHSVKDSEMFL